MLGGVHVGEGVVAAHIASAQQVPSVAVQGRVRCGVTHERHDGLAGRLQRPRGAPRVLQDVQADLSRLRAGANGMSTCARKWPSSA